MFEVIHQFWPYAVGIFLTLLFASFIMVGCWRHRDTYPGQSTPGVRIYIIASCAIVTLLVCAFILLNSKAAYLRLKLIGHLRHMKDEECLVTADGRALSDSRLVLSELEGIAGQSPRHRRRKDTFDLLLKTGTTEISLRLVEEGPAKTPTYQVFWPAESGYKLEMGVVESEALCKLLGKSRE